MSDVMDSDEFKNGVRLIRVASSGVVKDDRYDWVPPMQPPAEAKRGTQCGQCGMKFEYGQTYGYACGDYRCPMMGRK